MDAVRRTPRDGYDACMLSRRGSNALFLVLLCLVLSGVIALAVTISASGLTSGMTWRWTRAWAVGMLVATPTAFLLVPALRRFCDRLSR